MKSKNNLLSGVKSQKRYVTSITKGLSKLLLIAYMGAPLLSYGAENLAENLLGENIVDHGANGKDTIDDRAAIMRAVNASIANNSRVVIIPSGTFYLDGPITLIGNNHSEVTIKGIGKASQLRHRSSANAIELKNTRAITLKDFSIKGHATANAGVMVDSTHRNRFRNLFISGYTSTTSGLDNEGGACMKFKNSWIHNVRGCKFMFSNNGIYLNKGADAANALNIVDCVIEGIADTGIYLTSSSAVRISGCTIEGGGMQYGVYAKNGRGYSIQSCYFEGIKKDSIYLENSAFLRGVSISGNYFYMKGGDSAINVNGVQGAQITGNTFSAIPNLAVIRTRAGGYAREVWLTGNHHDVPNGKVKWSGYPYIKKTPSNARIVSGMWENLETKEQIHGYTYDVVFD